MYIYIYIYTSYNDSAIFLKNITFGKPLKLFSIYSK